MKVYKVRNKVTGEFWTPLYYGFVKNTGKVYCMKGYAKSACSGRAKKFASGARLEIVEYDLVEVKTEDA